MMCVWLCYQDCFQKTQTNTQNHTQVLHGKEAQVNDPVQAPPPNGVFLDFGLPLTATSICNHSQQT